MFYVLGKVGGFLTTPSNLLALLVLAGLVFCVVGWRRSAAACLGAGGLLILVFGLGPGGNWLLAPLEERFPALPTDAPPPTGIIVLGGGLEDRVSAARGGAIQLNEAGDRILALAALARRHPHARLVFSGGTGAFLGASEVPEAEIVRRNLDALGIDPARLVFEDRSRNTAENAAFTAALLAGAPGGRWWLVTSAFHMPRSIGVFRRAGLDVVAYPVDYRTAGPGDRSRAFATVSEGLRRTDLATKEWLGLIVYRLAGRTSALLPAP